MKPEIISQADMHVAQIYGGIGIQGRNLGDHIYNPKTPQQQNAPAFPETTPQGTVQQSMGQEGKQQAYTYTGDSAALQRLNMLQQRIQENQSASLVALLEMPSQPPQPEQHSLFVPLSGTILLAAIGYRVWKKYKGRA